MDREDCENALDDFRARDVDEDAGNQDAEFPVPLEVKRRAEANGEAVEEQVLPYRAKPVLEEREWLPNLKTVQFRPLSIEHYEQVEAAHKMLNQRGQGAGGFNPGEPVPSLWYADVKALRDGMRANVKGYAEQYERWVLNPVRDIIDGYRNHYRRKHGRMPPFRQQQGVNQAYRMLLNGRPWARIRKILADMLPEKHLEHIQRRVRPDHFNEDWGRVGRLQCRDGLLLEVHPPLLQWYAARLALGSIATQRPIRDLPSQTESPFKGRNKALEYARAIKKAFDTEVADKKRPEKNDLSRAIEGRGVDAVNAYKSMRDTMGIREGEDYDKGDVEGYVEAVRVLLYRHKVSKGQGGAKP